MAPATKQQRNGKGKPWCTSYVYTFNAYYYGIDGLRITLRTRLIKKMLILLAYQKILIRARVRVNL